MLPSNVCRIGMPFCINYISLFSLEESDAFIDMLHVFYPESILTSVTGLCAGKSQVTGEFPAQMASNAEGVSISWRHHGDDVFGWHVESGYKSFRKYIFKHVCIIGIFPFIQQMYAQCLQYIFQCYIYHRIPRLFGATIQPFVIPRGFTAKTNRICNYLRAISPTNIVAGVLLLDFVTYIHTCVDKNIFSSVFSAVLKIIVLITVTN